MDRQSVYSAHVFDANFAEGEDTKLQVQEQLEQFIYSFRLDNKFVYRCGETLKSLEKTRADKIATEIN